MDNSVYKIVEDTAFQSQQDLSTGSLDAIFEAYLFQDVKDPTNCKLTILLRLRLEQKNPTGAEGQETDRTTLDNIHFRYFPIRRWTASEWADFKNSAQQQADMWNNKFWLKPPPTFTKLDVKNGAPPGYVYRPYIRCELDCDFTANAAVAHKIVPVVNLDASKIHGEKDGGTFKSGLSLMFDSLDKIPWVVPFQDDRGKTNTKEKRYTIAHEIGHALGLDHIGVIMKTPYCMYYGGNAVSFCYGQAAPQWMGANVMGGGSQFSVENAKPWVWAIAYMEQRGYQYWEVLKDKPPQPAFLVRV